MHIKTCRLSSLEKVFWDECHTEREITCGTVLRGGTYNFQLAFKADDGLREDISVEISSELKKHIKCYQVKNVPVMLAQYPWADGDFLRKSPGMYPDLLEHCRGRVSFAANLWGSLWFEAEIPENTPAGEYPVKITLTAEDRPESKCETSFTMKVLSVTLPKQTLKHTEWFHCDCLAEYYNTPVFSENHWEIIENYMREAAHYGVNMILTPLFTPPLDTAVGSERPTVQLVGITHSCGKWSFDFSRLKRYIDLALDCGIEYFEFPHLFTQWGAAYAPKIIVTENGREIKKFGWNTPADSDKYADFLKSFIPAVKGFMSELGLLAKCYFHISDEPEEKYRETYSKAFSVAAPLLEGCNTIDALADYTFYRDGLIKTPVPDNEHAEEFYKNGVNERWTYYCCGQLDRVCNRMIAMPSYRNRALGLQLFKYRVSGFLHWGFNFWYNYLSRKLINPFGCTDAEENFPAGDPFLVYPGKDGKPLPSIRQLVLFEAFEDLRALELLASYETFEKTLGWLENETGAITFTEYPRDIRKFILLREKFNERLAELSAKK